MKHHKASASFETPENFSPISQHGHKFFSYAFHSYSSKFSINLNKVSFEPYKRNRTYIRTAV